MLVASGAPPRLMLMVFMSMVRVTTDSVGHSVIFLWILSSRSLAPTLGGDLGIVGELSSLEAELRVQDKKQTRLISIESQPKKIVVEVVVVIGVGVVVVHVVAVVIPVVDTRNIHNKVWLKPGY